MDPIEESLASVADVPPLAPAAASLSGPKILSFPLFWATGSTSIGIFTLRRLTFQRGATQFFSLSPLTMVTLLPSTNALILRPFKFLILRHLFALSPRSLLPFFNKDTSFSLRPMPLLPLNLVVWHRLPFFPVLLLGALLEVMTPPFLRLQQGHLLPLSPAMLLFLPPLVASILMGLTALLLFPGEWGEWGVLALLVALHPPMGFSPQDLLSTWVSLLPPLLSIIVSFISQVPFPGRFTVVFGGDHCHPTPGGFHHAPPPPVHNHHVPASVAAASALAALPLCPLSQEDLSASSALDLTMSFLAPNYPPVAVSLPPPPPLPGVTIPAPPPPPPGVTTPAPAPSSSQLVLSPTVVPLRPLEPFKRLVIKDAKAYLDVHDIIQYYLCQPKYATQRSDDALVTTPSNVAASLF
jgi:hypothetical protein